MGRAVVRGNALTPIMVMCALHPQFPQLPVMGVVDKAFFVEECPEKRFLFRKFSNVWKLDNDLFVTENIRKVELAFAIFLVLSKLPDLPLILKETQGFIERAVIV
jgi:hypothetical protein